LKNTADKVDADSISYNAIGWNQYMGYGRINAWDAVNVANGAPTRVYGLVSNSISQDHPVLSWTQNSSPNVSSYKIYKSINGADWVYVGSVSYPTITYTDTNTSLSQLDLTSNLRYYVSAVNTSNKTSIPCNYLTFTPPSAPGNFQRTDQDYYHPSFSWSLVSGQNVSSHKVYRNYDSQGWACIATRGSSVSTFVDSTVIYDKQPFEKAIFYYVKSVSNIGLQSIPSDTVYVEGKNILEASIKNNNMYNSSIKKTNIEYSLASYPNPFNPSTVINYSIPTEGHVTIKIYNLLSQEIATLVDETKSEGYYQARFNAQNLPSGVYIVRIQAGNFSRSIKLQMIK
jgi:hypothetical protein